MSLTGERSKKYLEFVESLIDKDRGTKCSGHHDHEVHHHNLNAEEI